MEQTHWLGGEEGEAFQLVRKPGVTLRLLHVLELLNTPTFRHYITSGIFRGIKVLTLDTVVEENVIYGVRKSIWRTRHTFWWEHESARQLWLSGSRLWVTSGKQE